MFSMKFIFTLIYLLIFFKFPSIFRISSFEIPVKCGIAPLYKKFSNFDNLMPNIHRLVGGLEADPHFWPWTGQLVLVEQDSGNMTKHKCGCTLIDHQFVVTAAHCFKNSQILKHYRVILGGHQIFSGQLFYVKNISIHPQYQIAQNKNVYNAYDVALLKIPPIEFNDFIWPICLPTVPAKVNEICTVTGWGRLKQGGPKSNFLNEIHVPIIASNICNDFQHYDGRMHQTSICAGFNSGKIDSCQGDSGGPLQCLNLLGQFELQGVVSWGIGCAQSKYPGIYTNMFKMTPWIRAEMLRLKLNT